MLLNVLIIGVLTGFCEEYLFRGVVQNVFVAWLRKPHVAIWLTAFVFSFVHFQFYGFLPRLVLGVLLGYLARANGSLWPSVAAHIFNNSAVVILLFLQYNGYLGTEIDSLGIGQTAWVGWLSLVVSAVLFKLLSAKNQ
jgi:membrane protease YdiL (CAAX protease family)